MNLDYKGFAGTRFVLTIICLGIAVYKSEPSNTSDLFTFMFQIISAYGLTEVGAKGATAYKERGK